jgi:uncharacterized membrane protein YdfJ with MMPL/SSD domain
LTIRSGRGQGIRRLKAGAATRPSARARRRRDVERCVEGPAQRHPSGTIGTVPGATFAVTGNTAQSVDQNALLKSKAPIGFGFVLIFAFGLLLVAFRSIVIAVKAIALNLVSVGAAYGVLVAIFQYGWGENLLDFSSNGGIAYWLPIFLF